MGLVGNVGKLRDLRRRLTELPKVVAVNVAKAVAPKLTGTALADFAAGRTAYGEARPLGKKGNALTLVQSGATQALMRFVSVGTLVRVALATRYAKYLVGKYKILPGAKLPAAWSRDIGDTARAEITRGLAV